MNTNDPARLDTHLTDAPAPVVSDGLIAAAPSPAALVMPGRTGWASLLDLNGYHWFVFVVAAWAGCRRLPGPAAGPCYRVRPCRVARGRGQPADVTFYGTIATSIFLIGWATGGIFFGILGDLYGRVKTMVLTILLYSLCTGLSTLSLGVWDFAFYRS